MRTKEKTKEALVLFRQIVDSEIIRLREKYPVLNADYIIEMHELMDWADKQIVKIKS